MAYRITFMLEGIRCSTEPIESEVHMHQKREKILGQPNVEAVEVDEVISQ